MSSQLNKEFAMLSALLIGLLAILYGAIQLGAAIGIRVFWWSLVVTGIVWIVEHLYGPVTKRLRRAE
jgi:4-hydroxybenzoate polyprenyltransferase